MKNKDHLFENCLLWLSDLSVYRCRLTKMQTRLASYKHMYAREGNLDSYMELCQMLQGAFKKLQAIEKKVIHSVKKRMNELYVPNMESWLLLENESDLYETMMTANMLVLNLQKSIYKSLSTTSDEVKVPLKDPFTKVVNMPAKKKIALTNRV